MRGSIVALRTRRFKVVNAWDIIAFALQGYLYLNRRLIEEFGVNHE
jgi:predicted Zn-dependent protease